jgi:ubiquinone/menaquinone biosynthesis C-methylase UbiE
MDSNKNENKHLKFEKDWKKRFELFATTYDDDAGIAGWSPSGLQTRLRAFLRAWNPDKTGRFWLDAGCGAGTYSGHLYDVGKDVIGVDYSFPTIEKAKTRLNPKVILAVADVTMLPFDKEVFEGAICFGVMQALENPLPALQNLKNVVQPRGEVWVDALNKWCLPNIWKRFKRYIRKHPAHLRYYSPAGLKKHVEAIGLNNVKLYWLPILPYRFKRFQWIIETRFSLWAIKYIPFLGLFLSHSFIIKGGVPERHSS